MSNPQTYVRLEPHIHDRIEEEVRARKLSGQRGKARGTGEFLRRLVYGYFGEYLPPESSYLPAEPLLGPPVSKPRPKSRVREDGPLPLSGTLMTANGKQAGTVSRVALTNPPRHGKQLATARASTTTPHPDDLRGQITIDGETLDPQMDAVKVLADRRPEFQRDRRLSAEFCYLLRLAYPERSWAECADLYQSETGQPTTPNAFRCKVQRYEKQIRSQS